MSESAEKNGQSSLNGNSTHSNTSSRVGTPGLTLPYADFAHALMRAQHDAYAMAAANRALADQVRAVLRRQQDLAFELAETAFGLSQGHELQGGAAAIFDRAAQAVREVGEALIDAQIQALKVLQNEAEPSRPAFAFPAMASLEPPVEAEQIAGKTPIAVPRAAASAGRDR